MGGKNGISAPAPSIAVEEHLSEEEGAGKRRHVLGTAAKCGGFAVSGSVWLFWCLGSACSAAAAAAAALPAAALFFWV